VLVISIHSSVVLLCMCVCVCVILTVAAAEMMVVHHPGFSVVCGMIFFFTLPIYGF